MLSCNQHFCLQVCHSDKEPCQKCGLCDEKGNFFVDVDPCSDENLYSDNFDCNICLKIFTNKQGSHLKQEYFTHFLLNNVQNQF